MPRRLDQALVERGLAKSRSRAQALIAAGKVTADGKIADKPSRMVASGAVLCVTALDHPWVSRGGMKLAAALDHFGIDPKGRAGIDLGASTGGFTDVLLNRGAERIYAVDVGHQQLAAKIREDPRVIVLEHMNVRDLSGTHIPEPIGIIVCDVSFIGLEIALPAALALAAPGAFLVALIKPQFEVGPRAVGKGGIVRDAVAQEAACERISRWLGQQAGWTVRGIMESPISGTDGNREFLISACRAG